MAKSKIANEESLPEVFPDTTVVTQSRIYFYTGIFCLFISIFLAIALGSYFFTWKEDQSEVLDFSWRLLFDSKIAITNHAGNLGALVAHLLVYDLFGISAILLIFLFFAIGINLVLDDKIFNTKRIFIFSILWICYFSTLASFIFPNSDFSFGGGLGNSIYTWLSTVIGKIGLSIVLLILGLIFLQINIKLLFLRIKNKLIALNNKRKEIIAEQQIQKNSTTKTTILEEDEGYELETANNTIVQLNETPLELTINTSEEIDEKTIISKIEEEDLTLVLENDILSEDTVINFDNNIKTILEKNSNTNKKNKEDITFEIEEVQPFGTIDEQYIPSNEVIEETNTTIENEITDETEGLNYNDDYDPNVNYDPKLDLSNYKHPDVNLLEEHGSGQIEINKEELEKNKNQIVETLSHYSIGIEKIKATIGPTVTLYEIVPEKGIRISKIKNLEDDIALSLSALGIRIIAPIPGKGTIGIEVPNVKKSIVSMKSLIASEKFHKSDMELPIALGKTISNEDFIIDLAKMPHLLMAGATGQGKSVGINAILVSLLYKKHPAELKLVLVDPKKVELSLYKLIENHFLAQLPNEEEAIITDTKKVIYTLNALCIEMDERYDLLKKAQVRHIKEYNQKFTNRRLNPNKGHRYLPYIVLVVDEFADLMMTAGKEVEAPIARLAQLARAIGIHLVIATQRPSVNIITGTIKANFPGRIAFKVTAKVDSRTILDAGGADQLIGRGDMLLSQGGDIVRLQCPFVDTPEVEAIAKYIGDQVGYPTPYELPEYVDPKEAGSEKQFDFANKDELFEEAARLIVRHQIGSTSLIQRKLALGYARSGRLMDQLEAFGIVGPNLGSKAREVYIKTEEELERILQG